MLFKIDLTQAGDYAVFQKTEDKWTVLCGERNILRKMYLFREMKWVFFFNRTISQENTPFVVVEYARKPQACSQQ